MDLESKMDYAQLMVSEIIKRLPENTNDKLWNELYSKFNKIDSDYLRNELHSKFNKIDSDYLVSKKVLDEEVDTLLVDLKRYRKDIIKVLIL